MTCFHTIATRCRCCQQKRRGVVLIIVLVVLVILSLSAYTFCDLMLTHKESALLSGKQIQARALVDSGAEAVKMFLAQPRATRLEAGGVFDNQTYFRGLIVITDENAKERGCFTVLAPNLDATGNQAGVRYGLQDESARLNLNALLSAEKTMPEGGRTLLMALPGMTVDIADAIMDWLDPDEEPREYGVEADYYAGLSPPYAPKNGPLETVEELLLVRGVTPQLLFGLDTNRNGAIDAHEQAGASAMPGAAGALPITEFTGVMDSGASNPAAGEVLDLGWSAFLTLYSQERNVDSEGNPRINLNEQDLTVLHEKLTGALGDEWANFIVAYRQSGPYKAMEGMEMEKGESAAGVSLDLTKQGGTQLSQLLDLIGVQTQLQGANGETILLASPFPVEAMGAFLPKLMDKCTTVAAEVIPGRININQAPRAILLGIPGLTEEMVNAILESREPSPDGSNPNHNFETWLAAEAIVTLDEMRALFPFINAGGDVYRAQVVGYYEGGAASARAEVIFDATKAEPRILFLRDISHLGRGYALETLGVQFNEMPLP